MTDLRSFDQDGEMQEYFLLNYPTMLMKQGDYERLTQILLNINFLAKKSYRLGTTAVLDDFNLPFCIKNDRLQQLRQIILQINDQITSCQSERDIFGLIHSVLTHNPVFVDAVARAELSKDTPLPVLTAYHPYVNLPAPGKYVPRKILRLGNITWMSSALYVAQTRNGKFLAINNSIGGIDIWNLETSQIYRQIYCQGYISAVDLSPLGDKLVIAIKDINDALEPENIILIWDVAANCQLLKFETHAIGVQKCNFNEDGTRFFSVLEDGNVQIWGTETGQLIATLKDSAAISDLVYDEKTRLVYTTSLANGIKIWDTISGEEVFEFNRDLGKSAKLSISQDGSLLASITEDGAIKIWNTVEHKVIANLAIKNCHALDCAISSDCKYTLSIFSDSSLRIWEIQSGQLTASLVFSYNTPQKCRINVTGECIVAFRNQLLYIWDSVSLFNIQGTFFPDKEQYIQNIANQYNNFGRSIIPFAVNSFHYINDENFVGIDTDKRIKIWNSRNGQISKILKSSKDEMLCVPTKENNFLVSLSNNEREYYLKAWNLTDFSARIIVAFTSQVDCYPTVCDVSRDGEFCVMGYSNGLIECRNMDTGELRYQVYGHRTRDPELAKLYDVSEYNEIKQIIISDNGEWFVTLAEYDSRIIFWDCMSGRLKKELSVDSSDECLLASLIPNRNQMMVIVGNRRYLSDSHRNIMKIVDTDNFGEILKAKLEIADIKNNRIKSCAVDPSSLFFVLTHDSGRVSVFDVTTGILLASTIIVDSIQSCAWSENNLIIVGGEKGAYFLWFVSDQEQWGRFGRGAFDTGFQPVLHYFGDDSIVEKKFKALRSQTPQGAENIIVENILYDLERRVHDSPIQSALIHNNSALRLAAFGETSAAQTVFRNIDISALAGLAEIDRGIVFFNQGCIELLLADYDMAGNYYMRALEIFDELRAKSWQAKIFENMAIIYYRTDDFQQALQCYLKALTLHEGTRNLKKSIEIKAKIGYIYKALNDHINAVKYMSDYFQEKDNL